MKYLALIVLGFFSILVALSLFGSYAFFAVAAVYSLSLYLFFYGSPTLGYYYLGGGTLGLELLGTSHLGLASFLSLITLFLYYGLGEQLRFTSPFFRYIVALFILLVAYILLLFDASTILSRIVPILIFYVLVLLISYLFTYRSNSPDELI